MEEPNNSNENIDINQTAPTAATENSAVPENSRTPENSASPEAAPKAAKDKHPLIAGLLAALVCVAASILIIVGIANNNNAPDTPDAPAPSNPVKSVASLDLDFIKLENTGENLIYSPLSIAHGLSLLKSGAASTTLEEIDRVLGDATTPSYDNIANTLSLANAVFIRDDFKNQVKPSYIETVEKAQAAEVIFDGFADASTLDSWTDQKTFGLIKTLGITPTEDTQMVLANALAIEMSWREKFDASSTYGNPFYLENGEEMQATTMHRTTDAPTTQYYKDDNVTALSMALDSKTDAVDLNFVAIMPEESTSLTDYIENVTPEDLDQILTNLTPANEIDGVDFLTISVPKFKFDYKLKFKDDLISLGMTESFTKFADFSNMVDLSGTNFEAFFVSDAVHKANIDFSEEGIKAAAVTAFAMVENSALEEHPPVYLHVNLDHPLLFLIYDAKNGAIWFTGAVYQPNNWADDAAAYEPVY